MIVKEIKDMTEMELKALAYDLISQIEITQKNLQTVNQAIMKRQESVVKTPVEVKEDGTGA